MFEWGGAVAFVDGGGGVGCECEAAEETRRGRRKGG